MVNKGGWRVGSSLIHPDLASAVLLGHSRQPRTWDSISLPYPVGAAAQPCPPPLASLVWRLDWEDCLSDSGCRSPKTASQNPTPAGMRMLSATCPTSPSPSSILLGPSKEISHHHPLSLSCAHPARFRQLVHLGSRCWAWGQPSQHRPAPRSLHPGVRDSCWPVHRDV